MILPGERLDDLQYNGLALIQRPDLFCFGTDSVELANFVSGRAGERAVDLGTGTGVIAVLLAAKRGFTMTAVEIQPELADMARRSVALNGLESSVRIETMPMQQAPARFGRAFDVAVCNPPYRRIGSGLTQRNASVARARHEVDVTLCEVVETAAGLLRDGGRFYTVYPTERMAEVMAACAHARLTPKVLQVLRRAAGKAPYLFLLECISGASSGLNVLHERDAGAY